MQQVFPIDYVRSALEFAFFKNRGNADYFNDEDIKLFTFYEHLASDEEVNRYVEKYQDLVEQQNKQQLIGSGILSATTTTSLINNKQVFISPFEWACTIRCTLGNRDKMLATLYKAFEELRGRKTDIACMDNGKLQAVGTIGNSNDYYIHDYDYIGRFSEDILTNQLIINRVNSVTAQGSTNYYPYIVDKTKSLTVFLEHKGKLELWLIESDGEDFTKCSIVDNFIYDHNSFDKMKLSLSFTDMKASDPYILNDEEYFELSFSGGATLTTKNVMLGNDLVKVRIAKNKVITGNNVEFSFKVNNNFVFYTLDPQEKASGNSAGTIENKLKSNFFKTNTHTDSLTITKQYTFVFNNEISLLNQWYEYASYGICNLGTNNALQQASMTPNIIYFVEEIENSWFDMRIRNFNAKLVEDIDINDTDSDVVTIGVTMQVQGDNN